MYLTKREANIDLSDEYYKQFKIKSKIDDKGKHTICIKFNKKYVTDEQISQLVKDHIIK